MATKVQRLQRQKAYRQYLQSPDWDAKRTAKHARSFGRCSICMTDQGPLDAHHLHYRNWVDVEMSDLRLLCRRCHDVVHLLMKEGVFRFTPEMSHHARYARMKHHVRAYLRRQSFAPCWIRKEAI